MPTTVTIPASDIDDITCHGGTILTPTTVTIRYDRRQQPHITIAGPTRKTPDADPVEHTLDFSACTCRTWLTKLVEHHRPKGFRTWEHAEWNAWEILTGQWINTEGAPDPRRDYTAALKFALADYGDCKIMRRTLTQALTATTVS